MSLMPSTENPLTSCPQVTTTPVPGNQNLASLQDATTREGDTGTDPGAKTPAVGLAPATGAQEGRGPDPGPVAVDDLEATAQGGGAPIATEGSQPKAGAEGEIETKRAPKEPTVRTRAPALAATAAAAQTLTPGPEAEGLIGGAGGLDGVAQPTASRHSSCKESLP
jgi:hypothetical protein